MAMNEKKNIDINVNANDNTGPGLAKVKNALNGFDKSIERTKSRLDKMMKSEYDIILKALDEISPVTNRLKSKLAGFSGGRPYRVTLSAIDKASKQIKEIKAGLVDLTSQTCTVTVRTKKALAGKASSVMDSGLTAMTGMGGSMLAGAGMAYGGYDTVKTFMDFEAQMSTVAAISGAGAEQMQQLTDKAKEMGAITSFSASDAGKAFEYMAMAGWKTEDMMGGIEGIMNLAAASGEDLGRVSDIVTDALTAFGLTAKDSAEFADVLAAASSNSNTNVAMMGDTFKYVAPVAGALKFSIEDTALAIGLMANAGIKGSEAGTAMRATFTRMVSPTKDSAAAMAALGLEVQNTDGSMKPLRTILKDIRQGFLGMTDAQKAETAAMLAGQEGMSGLLSIANASEADFNKLASAIDGSEGAAKRMADIRLDNLKGDVEQLGGAWETFQLTIMKGSASTGLRDFVQSTTEVLDKFTQSIKDGFDFSDIVDLSIDVLDRLKDKSMKLDGVGSLLAGGALFLGLKKIYGMTKKVYGGAKDILYGKPGSSGLGESAAAAIGKEMMINAQTVIVNGKSVGGSTGSKGGGLLDQYGNPIGGSKSPSKMPLPEPPAKGGIWGKISKFGKGAGKMASKAALPLMAAMGAYELYNAKDGEKASTAGNVGGGLVGGWAGAKAGATLGGAIGSVVPGAGTAVGATVGGVAGGIGGYMLGSDVGESIGAWASKLDFSAIKEKISSEKDEMLELASAWFDALPERIGYAVGYSLTYLSELPKQASTYFIQLADDVDSYIGALPERLSVWWQQVCTDASTWASQTVEDTMMWFSSLPGRAESSCQSLCQTVNTWASNTYNSVVNWFSSIPALIEGYFDQASKSISAKASGIWDRMTSGFSTGRTAAESDDSSKPTKSNKPFAWGGIMAVRQRGLVAEAGPEAIVPLSSGRRNRGLDIWQKAGQMLGADMGGDDESFVVPMPIAGSAPQAAGGTSGVSINISMQPTFEVSGGSGGLDENQIVAVLKAHARELADDIGDEVAEKMGAIFGNMPMKMPV